MAYCGAPTVTCVLMLLFLAVLYSSVSAKEDDIISKHGEESHDSIQDLDTNNMHIRVARSKGSNSGRARGSTNKRKDKDSAEELPRVSDNSEMTIDIKPKRGRGRAREDRRPQPEGGRRRPRPGGNKDGLPAGVNRKMMRLAEKIHTASTPFAARLFQVVTSKSVSNIVMSPFSVHTALTMTMLGAKGRTEREMFTALGHKLAKLRNKKAHQGYKGLLTSLLNVQPDIRIVSANAVFVKPNIPLEDNFRQGLTQMYNATFETFQLSHPQGPEAPINSWVADVTRNRIQGLLAPGTITPLTALVLVNALYFHASWSKPFGASLTKPDKFNTLSGDVQTVDMMCGINHYGYVNHYNTEVIEILYKGDRLAMYILLPNTNSSITQLRQQLTFSQGQGQGPMDHLFENLRPESLKFYLPKFKIEGEVLDLKQPLIEVGIVRAFNAEQADFSGISASGGLFISTVLHKAFIEVNENGTEAAAATAAIIGLRSSPHGRARELKADRPFMFVIRDKVLKEILFLGAYVGGSSS